MSGIIVLVRKTDGMEQSTKIKLDDSAALAGLRGLLADKIEVVGTDVSTKAHVDALIGVLQTVRESLPC